MTLSQERQDTLVKELEVYARKHPEGYRLRVILLILLGYGYIVVVLGGLAFVLLALLAVQYAVLVLVGLGSLFLMRVPPPKGVRLDRTRFPKLFQEIDQLCTSLNAPKPHEVVLTDDLNAAVLQAPKLGLFAWYTNYLMIGLPLMQAVSPGQFRATLAHEMGHLAGNHSRFSGWVYRVRRAWAMLAAQQGDRASVFMYPFFKWYEPFFRAYTFVLSRNDEYFADRCSAQYAGTQNAAEDLIQIYIKGAKTIQIWSDIYKQAAHQAQPPDKAISTLLQRLQTETTPEEAQTWFEIALARPTDNDDTHPSLADRLQAYGYRYQNGKLPTLPLPVEQTAADYFLGHDIDWAATLLNAEWQQENAQLWQRLHQGGQMRSQFFQQLSRRAQAQPLTVEEALKLALLTAEFDSETAAIAQLRSVVQQAPEHAIANYELGKRLLQADQPEGLAYLETAIRQEPLSLLYCFEPLHRELKRQGQTDKAESYLQAFRQLLPTWQRAQKERQEIGETDPLIPHTLSPRETEQIIWQLTQFPEVREAYLVQRQVTYLPESKCYVLGIVSQFNRQNPMNSLQSWELVELISQTLCLSGDVRVVGLNDRPKALYQRLRHVQAAKIV